MENNIVHKLFRNAMGLALAATLGGPAIASPAVPVACRSFTSVSVAYDDCVGLTGDNTSLASANNAFVGDPTYSIEYKDDPNGGLEHNSSVFDLVNNFNDTVTLTFLQNIGNGGSAAVIGLKFGGSGGNQLGYFRFNNADFNIGDTLTFSWNPSFIGDGISHATLYANTVVPGGNVPEPATAALMLAGLAGIAATARRRRG